MPNCPKITLEMLHVHRIEPDQRRIQPNIQLRHFFTKNERPAVGRDDTFEFIQCAEDGNHVLVVFFLCRCKPRLVHSRVDIGLHPGSNSIDRVAQVFRVEVN